MGIGIRLSCDTCGSTSGEIVLGFGRTPGYPEAIVGVCRRCKEFVQAYEGAGDGDCEVCEAKQSVVPAAYQGKTYACPHCRKFSVSCGLNRLWD